MNFAALPLKSGRESPFRIDRIAWMTLAGGWLAAFTVTAGVANFVRPYRVAWGAAGGDERYRSAPSS
jgi:hypothetical protein